MTRQKQISISISRIRQTLLIISSLLICSPVLAQKDAKKAPKQKVVNGKCPVDVIDMRDYGMIRGDKVLEKALKLVGKE